jgi:very-short-patch-repair endonuclease
VNAQKESESAVGGSPFLLPLREKVDRPKAETDEGAAKSLILRGFARRLRREGTEVEKKLWRLLRDRRFSDYKFRRQVPIDSYIVDFVCYSARLIVEMDGSQHADSAADARRDARLIAQGFRILRIWNNDLTHNRRSVLDAIWAALVAHPSSGPSDHLLPQGEKEGGRR